MRALIPAARSRPTLSTPARLDRSEALLPFPLRAAPAQAETRRAPRPVPAQISSRRPRDARRHPGKPRISANFLRNAAPCARRSWPISGCRALSGFSRPAGHRKIVARVEHQRNRGNASPEETTGCPSFTPLRLRCHARTCRSCPRFRRVSRGRRPADRAAVRGERTAGLPRVVAATPACAAGCTPPARSGALASVRHRAARARPGRVSPRWRGATCDAIHADLSLAPPNAGAGRVGGSCCPSTPARLAAQVARGCAISLHARTRLRADSRPPHCCRTRGRKGSVDFVAKMGSGPIRWKATDPIPRAPPRASRSLRRASTPSRFRHTTFGQARALPAPSSRARAC